VWERTRRTLRASPLQPAGAAVGAPAPA